MRFDILTLFPELFEGVFGESIVRRAVDAGLVEIHLHNIRDYATDKHQVTDDEPYGGGGGMVMKAEPIFRAVESITEVREPGIEDGSLQILLLSPAGRLFNQSIARELADRDRLVLICGRYEGVDERVRQHLATDEISIGDYVLSGGEIPAMVVVESVVRLLPGALGDPMATAKDSHAAGLLEHPHYTRPSSFRGWQVPAVLLSGHHAEVDRWRREQALLRTGQVRPDLLGEADLTETDREVLELHGIQGAEEQGTVQRIVNTADIADAVEDLFASACYVLPDDVITALNRAKANEVSATARELLENLLENADIAARGEYPLCQDTGFPVVFVELGQDVQLKGAVLEDAVAEGIRRATLSEYLRPSLVAHPYTARSNTGDNTPPVVHVRLTPGDALTVTVMPKGAGSENMSALAMLTPADGRPGVIDFVVGTVERAGANACPPLVVGVGIGGTAEHALLLARRSLLRQVRETSPNREDAALEADIEREVNALGIGPLGFGGQATALAVHVDSFPCHMASLPVGVILQCHSARHCGREL